MGEGARTEVAPGSKGALRHRRPCARLQWDRSHSPLCAQSQPTIGKAAKAAAVCASMMDALEHARSRARAAAARCRPGIWRLSAMRTVGEFQAVAGAAHAFEWSYALRYVGAGFRTAFLPGVHCIHMAARKFALHSEGHAALLDAMLARHGLDSVGGIQAYTVSGGSAWTKPRRAWSGAV